MSFNLRYDIVHNYQVRRSETGTGNGLSIYFEKKKLKTITFINIDTMTK